MARRVESLEDDSTRRYPWGEWTDGSVWEIKKGEDYEVPTENMRVNLHDRAKGQGLSVQTRKVGNGSWEGLRFQFVPRRPEPVPVVVQRTDPLPGPHMGMNPWSAVSAPNRQPF